MTIDKKSIIPLYYQLADILRDKIISHEILPGELLPSELTLMQKFQISRGTVRQAIQQLVLDGLIERYPGKGTFVSIPKIEQNANKKMGFFTLSMHEAGRNPSAKILSIEEMKSPRHIQKLLKIGEDEKIVAIKRLRLVDDEPWAIELEYFRQDIGLKLIDQDLTGSIYNLLQEKFGYVIHRSKNTIEAISADKEAADRLHVKSGAPLLEVKRIVFVDDGTPFEYAIDLMRADRIKFSIEDNYQEDRAQFRIKAGDAMPAPSLQLVGK